MSWRRTAQAAEQVPSGRSTRQAGRLQGRDCRCRIGLQDRRKTGFVRLTTVASHHILENTPILKQGEKPSLDNPYPAVIPNPHRLLFSYIISLLWYIVIVSKFGRYPLITAL